MLISNYGAIYTVRTVGVCGPGPFAVVGIGNIVNSKFNVVYDGNGKTDLLNLNDVINRRFFPPRLFLSVSKDGWIAHLLYPKMIMMNIFYCQRLFLKCIHPVLPLMSWLSFPASPLSCLPHGLSPLSCLLFVLPLPPPRSVTLRGVKHSEMLANAEVSCNFYITAQKLISWKYVLKNEIICQHILACYSGGQDGCFMTEKIL